MHSGPPNQISLAHMLKHSGVVWQQLSQQLLILVYTLLVQWGLQDQLMQDTQKPQ